MDRQFLINEIRRLANEDCGRPPGKEKFQRETGVPPAQWLGIYWAKWSDALAEAGFEPNLYKVAYDKEFLLEKLAMAVRDLQKFPSMAEWMLYARSRTGFPDPKAIERHFKSRSERRALKDYCEHHSGWSDVLDVCWPLMAPEPKTGDTEKPSKPVIKGHVYLMRSGRYYKIGKSKHAGGRESSRAIFIDESFAQALTLP